MKEFKIEWVEKIHYSTTINAETEEEAENKFFEGNYNINNIEEQGGQLIDNSIIITEVEE